MEKSNSIINEAKCPKIPKKRKLFYHFLPLSSQETTKPLCPNPKRLKLSAPLEDNIFLELKVATDQCRNSEEESDIHLSPTNIRTLACKADDVSGKIVSDERIERNLSNFKFYTEKDENEERCWGISTRLKINLEEDDPWKIKKILKRSDVNDLSRLMISAKLMHTHVLSLMRDDMVKMIESGDGVRVEIWDYDCGCSYELTLKKWRKNKCYVFNNIWTAVVKKRGLREGDEVGLFWDRARLRFGFRVLSRVDHRNCA